MAIHKGSGAKKNYSGKVPLKRGTLQTNFVMGSILYGAEKKPVLDHSSTGFTPLWTNQTNKEGILQPVFVVSERKQVPHVGPEYVVGPGGGDGDTIIEEVIVEVEKVYQPRKEPLEWFPEVWNGQKPKE